MLHVTGPGALRMSFSLEVFAELGRDMVYLKIPLFMEIQT
jgi:hypothetical protein